MTKRSKFIMLATLPVFFASYVQGADSQCNSLIYAVHDGETNNSQFLTINPLAGFKVAPLGPEYPGKNIEGLAIHPQTGELFGASGGDESEAAGHLYRVNKSDGALSDLGSIRVDYEGTMLSGRGISSLSFHPDGSLWGWSNECGLLQINEQTATAELKLLLTSPEVCRSGKLPKDAIQVEDLTWDNQGKVIYAAAGNEVWAYTYQTGELKQVARLPAARHIETLKMLPEGLLLVGVHGSASLKAINPETGGMVGEVNINTSPYNDVEGVAWSSSCALKVATGTEGGNSDGGTSAEEQVVPSSITKIAVDTNTGGVLKVRDALVVEVPAGAVTQPTTLWVEEIKTVVEVLDSHTGQIVDKEGLSSIFKFGPEGTTFVVPVTVQLKYNPEAITPGFSEEDVIALHNGKAIPRVLDTVTHTMTATLSHFSNFTAALKYCQEEGTTVADEAGIEYWVCNKTLPFCQIVVDATNNTVRYEYGDKLDGGKCTEGDKIDVNTTTIVVRVDRNLGGKYELRILADETDIPPEVEGANTIGTFRSQTVKTLASQSPLKSIVAINGSLFDGPAAPGDTSIYGEPKAGTFATKTLIMDGVLKSRFFTISDAIAEPKKANEVFMAFGGSKEGGSIPIQRLVKTENTFSKIFNDEFGVLFDNSKPQIEVGVKEKFDYYHYVDKSYIMSQNSPNEASKIPNSERQNSALRWAVGSSTTILRTDGSTLRCPYRDERFYDAVKDNLGDAVSAIGYSENHIVFLSSQFSYAMFDEIGTGEFYDYQHLCGVFRAFDTTDAIELDGGDSSQLVVEGELKNRKDENVRHVANAISLVALPIIEKVEPKQVLQGSRDVFLDIYGKNLDNYPVHQIDGIKFIWLDAEPNWLDWEEGYYPFKIMKDSTHIQVPVEEIELDATPGYRDVQIRYGRDVAVLHNAFEIIALPEEQPKQSEQPQQPEAPNCTFTDLNQVSSDFADAIQALCQKGIVQGNLNTSGQHVYRPLDNATLAETLKILVYASDYERIHNDKARVDSNPQYFLQDAAQRKPPVTIVDETFLTGSITRAKAMEYLAKLFYHYGGSQPVDFLVKCGITNGSDPQRLLYRGELAILAYRAMQIKECLPN